METDDIVRRNLDRKTKVDEIRYKVDSAIQQSAHVVYKSRSPMRDSVSKSQGPGQESKYPSAFQVGNQRQGRGASYHNADFSPAGKRNYRDGHGSPLRERSGSPPLGRR